MKGEYVSGQGKASKCCAIHTNVFKTKMIGTFNILVPGFNISKHQPSIELENKDYWLVRMVQAKREYFGWAIRDRGSKQRLNTLEILTKKPLPESLKSDYIDIDLYKPWHEADIKSWAKHLYWFQSFPFATEQRADSKLVWDTINIIDWSGLSVFDFGCHYGYFSFEASKEGAIVTGVDINRASLKAARTIRNHIIQQDVNFTYGCGFTPADVILYLSVHHQIDPEYKCLEDMVKEVRSKARKYAFIELIMPPMFGKNESEIDKIVGGKILKRYKHKVRGDRKIYFLEM